MSASQELNTQQSTQEYLCHKILSAMHNTKMKDRIASFDDGVKKDKIVLALIRFIYNSYTHQVCLKIKIF